MKVELLSGSAAGLPPADRAAQLLREDAPDPLSLACADASAAYAVLRTVMDYGYEHDAPAVVRLVCTDDAVYKAYRFQWNMWYAERKPTHEHHPSERDG